MRSKYRIPHYLMGGWCAIACPNCRRGPRAAAVQDRGGLDAGWEGPNDRFQRHATPVPVHLEPSASEIRAELLARLESVLTTLFPAGKKRRGKFLIGDVLGSPGDSLEVVLDGEKAGLWTDRATATAATSSR
jgi:hypothetical protein